MTVARLVEEMDSEEFLAWRTLMELEADEQERAERGQSPRTPLRRPPRTRAAARRQLVTDPGEISRWFASNR